jgi:hypothetical protein
VKTRILILSLIAFAFFSCETEAPKKEKGKYLISLLEAFSNTTLADFGIEPLLKEVSGLTSINYTPTEVPSTIALISSGVAK